MAAILGYADPLVASPGSTVDIKVSCSKPTYVSQLVRLGPGLEHPDAPPVNHRVIEAVEKETHEGRLQFSRPGSFVLLEAWGEERLQGAESFNVSFRCQPTLPEAGHRQYLFSSLHATAGFALLIDRMGGLCVGLGGNKGLEELSTSITLRRNAWYLIDFTVDVLNHTVTVKETSQPRDMGEGSAEEHAELAFKKDFSPVSGRVLTIASGSPDNVALETVVESTGFNGKIDTFKLIATKSGQENVLLDLDFSIGISTDVVHDVSGNKRVGTLVNCPTRGVTGPDWDASECDWTRATFGYGAIYFHDDALDNAAWKTSFQVHLPRDLQSGAYAVSVDDGSTSDLITLFVRPDPAKPKPKVAFIASTFTYTGKGTGSKDCH